MTTNTNRLVALANGEKTYAMTKACKYGHLGERYTSCGICVECSKRKQEEMRVKTLAGRKLSNTKKFEPSRVYSVVVRSAHREAYDDFSHIAAFGTDEQFAQVAAFVGMIRSQVVTHAIARTPGELNRDELAALVNLDPAHICNADGSPLVERNHNNDVFIRIAGRWYNAEQLAAVWRSARTSVRPVSLP